MIPENNLDIQIRLLKPCSQLVVVNEDSSSFEFDNRNEEFSFRNDQLDHFRPSGNFVVDSNDLTKSSHESSKQIEDIFSELLDSDEDFKDTLSHVQTDNIDVGLKVNTSEEMKIRCSTRSAVIKWPNCEVVEQCPSCDIGFDNRKRRRISELCGHTICLTCSSANDTCPMCRPAVSHVVTSTNDEDNACEILLENGQLYKQSINRMPSEVTNIETLSVDKIPCDEVIILSSQESTESPVSTVNRQSDVEILDFECPDLLIAKSRMPHGQDNSLINTRRTKRAVRWISDDVHDSGPKYNQTYAHSDRTIEMFRQVFGLKNFRPNQLEAINAALLNEDCFILMPTGGGKSLCYQLPAYLQFTDETGCQGVTVVISPLKALILDQVQKLQCLGIPAMQLSSCSKSSPRKSWQCSSIDSSCRDVAIVYVTPEKLGSGQSGYRMLDQMHAVKRLRPRDSN